MDGGRPRACLPMHATVDPHEAGEPSPWESLPLGVTGNHFRMLGRVPAGAIVTQSAPVVEVRLACWDREPRRISVFILRWSEAIGPFTLRA